MPRVADDEVRCAEFQTLRDEELKCIEAQRDLVRFNLAASGAIAALAIADAAKPGLLAILAFLSPVLGLLWIDQDRRIHLFARYIKEELWIWKPGWETWLAREKGKDRLTALLAYGVPSVVVFVLPAIAGLIVSCHHVEDIGGRGVWYTALAPLLLFGIVGFIYRRQRRKRGTTPATRTTATR